MKSRAKTREKKRSMDWIVVQWARACEERLNPDVADLERAIAVERDEKGRLADPSAYLYSRAVETLKLFDAPVERWLERLRRVQIASAALVIALGAVVFPFARVKTILGDGVNLAGPFLFFLATQLFFLVLALALAVLTVLMGACRRLLGRDRPVSFSEKVVQALSSVVGTFAIMVVRRYAPVVYKLFGRPSRERFMWRAQSGAARRAREENPEVALKEERRLDEARRAGACFWDVLFSRPRAIAFWGCALSHTFWASCSICVLVILAARMQSNRYDYCWRTSLEDERVVKRGVDVLGAPIAKLGGAVPTESDVATLFDDDLRSSSESTDGKVLKTHDDEARRRTAAETRARWSYFLLSIVFVWCIVPRFVLVAIYSLLYRHAARDFRPDLADPFFRKIIDRAEDYRSTTVAVAAPESDDDAATEEAPVSEPAAPIWNPRVADVKRIEKSTKKNKTASRVAVSNKESEVNAPVANATSLETNVAPQDSVPKEIEKSLNVSSSSEKSEPTASDVSSASATAEDSSNDVSVSDSSISVRIESETSNVSAVEVPKASPEEIEERRQTSALAAIGGLAESAFTYRPQPPGIALAFCYDATVAPELTRELVGTKRELALFGDAAEFDVKKTLSEYLAANGAKVELCVVLTDVGLPPARHFVRFMRDVLTPALGAAKIVVVLSGGERMRLKFATAVSAVGERIEDWTKTLEAMANASGKEIEPTFYYDAELNLPEPRARLQAFLSGADELEKLRKTPRSLAKWDAASKLILHESREIFESPTFVASDEAQRLRVSRVTGEIFKIYSEELGKAAYFGRSTFAAGFGAEAASRFANSKLGEGISRRVDELGLSSDFLESRLATALGLGGRFRSLCGKLSPKCALAAASVGLSAPIVVAFAPLIGGAITTSAVLSTLGAVGSALPASLVSGAAAGALGALAPEALKKSGAKLAEKLWGGASSGGDDREGRRDVAGESDRRIAVATLVCATATWTATLELQGLAEDDVVATLPDVLKPLEDSPLDSVAEVETALAATRAALAKVPLV